MPPELTNTAYKCPKVLVFDSGVGGLSILNELAQTLTQVELIFACDNAAFPYGIHDESALASRVLAVISQLITTTTPDLVVIACNTASTLVLDTLRSHFHIPFVGVVPAIKPAASVTKTGVIGLLATPATVCRPYTEGLVSEFAKDLHVIRIGNTDLVHAAEQKLRGKQVSEAMLYELLAPFREEKNLDVVVLACTHFPLLVNELQPLLPSHVQWIDSTAAIARRVSNLLPCTTTLDEGRTSPPSSFHTYVTAMDTSLSEIKVGTGQTSLSPIVALEV